MRGRRINVIKQHLVCMKPAQDREIQNLQLPVCLTSLLKGKCYYKKNQNNFLLKTLKLPLISKAVLSYCLKSVLVCVKKKLSDQFPVSVEVSMLGLLIHHTETT